MDNPPTLIPPQPPIWELIFRITESNKKSIIANVTENSHSDI